MSTNKRLVKWKIGRESRKEMSGSTKFTVKILCNTILEMKYIKTEKPEFSRKNTDATQGMENTWLRKHTGSVCMWKASSLDFKTSAVSSFL